MTLTCKCGFTAGTESAFARHAAQGGAHALASGAAQGSKRKAGTLEWRAAERKVLRSSLRLPFLCSCGFTAGTKVAFTAHVGRFKSGHSRMEQEEPIGTEPPASQRVTPLPKLKRPPAPAPTGSPKPAASRRRTPASGKRLRGASAAASPSALGLFSPLAPNLKRLPFMSDSS